MHNNNKYLVRVLVVLLHACFSIVCPIPFLLATFFGGGHPYIGCTTVLPDNYDDKKFKNKQAVLDCLVLPLDEG